MAYWLGLALFFQVDAEGVPTIRVLVHSASSVTVECRGLVLVRKPGVPRPILTIAKLASSTLALANGKVTFLGQEWDESWLTLEARDPDHPIKLANKRSYAQQLHVVRSGTTLNVVSEVDLETYLEGVVGSEIGSGSPFEAVKAQAVAARSYAIACMGGMPRPGQKRPVYDVYDDERSQVYIGVPAASSNVKRAIQETNGVCVVWKKDVVKTYFSSSCGGHTQGVREWTGGTEIPPLSGVPCGFCEGMPRNAWSARVTLDVLTQKLKKPTNERPLARVSIKQLTSSGRVAEVLVEALDGKRMEVSGADFVEACGGRNRMFAVRMEGNTVVLEGKGYGHGVGLCQFGAIVMAERKKTWEQIIGHYYPGTQIIPIYGAQRARSRY